MADYSINDKNEITGFQTAMSPDNDGGTCFILQTEGNKAELHFLGSKPVIIDKFVTVKTAFVNGGFDIQFTQASNERYAGRQLLCTHGNIARFEVLGTDFNSDPVNIFFTNGEVVRVSENFIDVLSALN